jgi:predicted GNAT family acetyltransferase
VERGKGVTIASVFVEEKYRGKGYASTMLSLFNTLAKEKGF